MHKASGRSWMSFFKPEGRNLLTTCRAGGGIPVGKRYALLRRYTVPSSRGGRQSIKQGLPVQPISLLVIPIREILYSPSIQSMEITEQLPVFIQSNKLIKGYQLSGF